MFCNNDYSYDVKAACAGIIIDVMDAADPKAAQDPAVLHARASAGFERLEKACRACGLARGAVLEIIYPLAALTDELMLCDARYGYYWSDDSVQLRYFGNMRVGTGFFDRLELLMGGGAKNEGLLEIYYVCLALGFKGVYGVGGGRRLRDVFENLGALLAGIRAERGGGEPPRMPDAGIPLPLAIAAAASLLAVAAATAAYLFAVADITEFLNGFL